MKRPVIYCEERTHGSLSFFLTHGNTDYYLFTQTYHTTLWNRYHGGLPLDDSLDFGKCSRTVILEKFTEKLPTFLRYIENEYSIAVTRRSVKSKAAKRPRRRGRCPDVRYLDDCA